METDPKRQDAKNLAAYYNNLGEAEAKHGSRSKNR